MLEKIGETISGITLKKFPVPCIPGLPESEGEDDDGDSSSDDETSRPSPRVSPKVSPLRSLQSGNPVQMDVDRTVE